MTLETILTNQLMQIGSDLVGTLCWVLPAILIGVIVLQGMWDCITTKEGDKYNGRR